MKLPVYRSKRGELVELRLSGETGTDETTRGERTMIMPSRSLEYILGAHGVDEVQAVRWGWKAVQLVESGTCSECASFRAYWGHDPRLVELFNLGATAAHASAMLFAAGWGSYAPRDRKVRQARRLRGTHEFMAEATRGERIDGQTH